ncbi:hypothetical protein H5410_027861 [Solanum commersonii]|uniref:Uncharacterized protein n=1 Tax=Solanum commersonii TaxID=4109 RepID=A0A9J5Z0D1_SOLCO|nr:hypothetical protein H5410_027861 [Solanum commersonii]
MVVPRLIKPRDIFDMGEENSMQLKSSMNSDSTDLAILENSHVPDYENNDCVRSGVDRITIDMEVHTQASPNNDEANIEGGNDIKNEIRITLTQDQDDQSNKLNNLVGGIDESCNSEARKVRGPTLLKHIWKLPPGKTVDVPTLELEPLHVDDWRNFDNEETKKLLNFVRDMINEKMSNSEGSTYQPHHRVSWKGDVYSQVLGNERSGYVCGLGLGRTPSTLWGSRSFFENIDEEDSSNEIVQRLEQEINELKAKQNDEINMMKQNQDNM